MVIDKTFAGIILYALLFCALFPGLLIWWETKLDTPLFIHPSWNWIGIALTIVGSLLILESFWRLWRDGKGLPMNAFPPSQYVKSGAYKLFYHPIYVGFSFGCAGVSIVMVSAAGLFIVTPIVMLLCTALVVGYENIYLREKFGNTRHQTFFGLRQTSHSNVTLIDGLGVFCSTFILWAIFYQVVLFIGVGDGYIDTVSPLEEEFPIIELFEIPYAFTYFFVGITPFVLNSQKQLRKFQLTAWWIIGSGFFLQLMLPFYSEARPFVPTSWLGKMIMLERQYDGIAAAFPSFHALWAFASVMMFRERFPRLSLLWISIGILVAISCVAIGVHSIADIVAAVLVFVLVVNRKSILAQLNRICEWLADSWKEWHFGKLRVINHSLYAGFAAFIGFMMACQFSVSIPVILITIFSALIGGALWGQFIEGSKKMLRPFGYYGAILGGVLGLILSCFAFEESALLHLAVISVVSPWVHAVGRFRCLVQGCCHGRACGSLPGISYVNRHSRVTHSGLGGIRLYNTQLISIASSIVIGAMLWRFWYAGMNESFLTGMYFILTGAARFVEEAYRGEIQTRTINGLRIYQWLAIFSILAGILITSIESYAEVVLQPRLSFSTVLTGLVVALSWAFGMGMDFPKSNFRFSRLTG